MTLVKVERKKNAIKGTLSGMLFQSFNILLPFAIRSIMIRIIGISYAGLDTLFKSILQVLNLTELGVGTALVFSMYKPIAEGNKVRICALMKLYKSYYRMIGVVILCLGMAISPILPNLIKDDIPSELNLYVLYYLNLATTVLSYLLYSYKSAILNAYQRTDVINIVNLVICSIKYIIQIVIIILYKNYYMYLAASIVCQVLLNITIAIAADKRFPGYDPCGNITKDERKQISGMVRDLFTAKIGGVVLTSVDTIVISAFLGLRILAIYNNYYYILSALFAFFMVLFNACRAGIANELLVETKKKNVGDFYKLTFIVCFFVNICVSCLLALLQPFMTLWIGSKFLLENKSIVLLSFYFITYILPVFWSVYKDAAGVWRQDRFRPLVGAAVNLIANIVLVKYIGVNGVILSTIISEVFVCIPWLMVNIRKNVLPIDLRKVVVSLSAYMTSFFLSGVVVCLICRLIKTSGVSELIIKLLISVVVSILIWCVILWRTEEAQEIVYTAKRVLGRKVEDS